MIEPRLHATVVLLLAAIVFLHWIDTVDGRGLPEATSTLLRLHQHYLRQPPHDTTLYDILDVSPNATASEIHKSYRKLSRKLHPDKQRHDSDANIQKEKLERVRLAYDVLKDDPTRLPYHRYGLVNAHDAVSILTGNGVYQSSDPLLIQELLQLMGYMAEHSGGHSLLNERQQRVWLVASNLIELMRPVVDGSLDDSYLMDHVMQQCDRLKRLPLGAQIVRCVGRAYRYQGHRALRRYNHDTQYSQWSQSGRKVLDWRDRVHDTVREAQHLAVAAVAGGRVLWNERALLSKTKRPLPDSLNGVNDRGEFGNPPVEPHTGDGTSNDSWTDESNHALTEEDIKEKEKLKADRVLLESLQVEAFWKICKIDLDRVVREACDLILSGDYFFFPSHSLFWNEANNENEIQTDGWVGSSGAAIQADSARYRTAVLLTRMGDIMVQRSKQGTAWME